VKAVNRVSVRGRLSHGGLRKDNPDIKVITGFYRSPGIAAIRALLLQRRVKTLDGELGVIFKRWYPDMDLEVD